MRSIKFPKMFNTNSTRVWKSDEYLEATKQNTILTLHCEKGELFGDPYFGVALKRLFFDQNNAVLRDAVIDQIYVQLALFIPQVRVKRTDITIIQNQQKGLLTCQFKGINQIDYQVNTYNLVLFDEND